MITNTMVSSFDVPKKRYVFPPEDYRFEDRGITDRQRHILLDLLEQKIADDSKKALWLSQISSFSESDAEDAIYELLVSQCR
jgi:hypothetical protein